MQQHDSINWTAAPVAAILASLDDVAAMMARDAIKGRRRQRRAMRQSHGRKR